MLRWNLNRILAAQYAEGCRGIYWISPAGGQLGWQLEFQSADGGRRGLGYDRNPDTLKRYAEEHHAG